MSPRFRWILTTFTLSMAGAYACGLVFLVVLYRNLPATDPAYGIGLWRFAAPVFEEIGAYVATAAGLISFPPAYYLLRGRRLRTAVPFVYGSVLLEIVLVAPFSRHTAFLGAFAVLLACLILVTFSDHELFQRHRTEAAGEA